MTLFNDFLSLIYPRQCEACGTTLIKKEKYLCIQCLTNLPKSHQSAKAGKELEEVFAGRVPVCHASYVYTFEKNGKIQNLIHAIKYEGQKELATFLGEQIDEDPFRDIDFIIPIPLHLKKLEKRGYNQSAYFAIGISNRFQIPLLLDCLIRVKETSTQTKKRKYARWENVEDVFKITDAAALKNKHVLLVDDVITTGATIEAAWQALKEIEGIKISVSAIAFAQKQ